MEEEPPPICYPSTLSLYQILEECYRIKAENSSPFKKPGELYAYLKARQEEDKRNGIKYVSYFDPSKHTPPEKSNDDV